MKLKIYGIKKTKRDKEKELRTYRCPWCGYAFKQFVGTGYSEGRNSGDTAFTGKLDAVSDQVQCKNCGNFLRTWEGQNEKGENN